MALKPVYSTRFLAIALENGDVSYIVPAGYVAVVRSIHLFYVGGPTAANCGLRASGNHITLAYLANVKGNDYIDVDCRHVVLAGEPIDFDASSANAGQCYCSGYLLTLP